MTNLVIDALRTHAERTPEAIALRGDGGELTYAALWMRVSALSRWLLARAPRVIGLRGENSPEWILADLAAWTAGIPVVPLPAFFSAAQTQHVIRSAGIDHILACNEDGDAAPDTDIGCSPVRAVRLHAVQEAHAQAMIAPGICKITFTSGTTGQPKGVCLSTSMLEAVTRGLATRLDAVADSSHSHFTLLPLSTLLENVAGVYVPLLLGKSITVRTGGSVGLHGSSGLDLPRLLQALHEAQPASLIVLPQILQALVHAVSRGSPLPASLRFIAVGGAATPVALLHRAQALGIPVFEGYGLSECASVVALNAPGANRPGSVGRVLDHVRVRIDGDAVSVAGNVFAGYLGQPPLPHDAWLDTGDLGRIDEDGFLHVTGRRKNLLITSYGRNVSPEWIEAELSLCPSIAQAMVIGDAQPFLSAIVVPRPGVAADAMARDIDATNASLPDYARIRRVIVAAEPFTTANQSLTDNGRLQRDVVLARHTASIAALDATSSRIHESGVTHEFL
jgi:long-chain acyl-CoA synthetase